MDTLLFMVEIIVVLRYIEGMETPFQASWWVVPGKILAGRFPGAGPGLLDNEALDSLLSLRTGLYVNLQELDEHGNSGQPFPDYTSYIRENSEKYMPGRELVFKRYETPDGTPPSKDSIRDALDHIYKALDQDLGVYIHCWGGHGRTGTVVGCYLREQGLSAEEAFQYMFRAREHDQHLMKFDAPQTAQQRDVIRNWTVDN
jgi:hypothetical protein